MCGDLIYDTWVDSGCERDAAFSTHYARRAGACCTTRRCHYFRRKNTRRGTNLTLSSPCEVLSNTLQTSVSQSSLFVHLSEEIFVCADDFAPERWLGPDAAKLDQFLVAFSDGPRSCQGIKWV